MDEVDENGWDLITEETEEEDIFDALVQVGGDFPPEYADGGLVVTPRLRARLLPGELELYQRGLERKLRFYAWSRVDALGTGQVDPESMVQEALLERHLDPRELPASDVERFAVRLIASRAIDAARKASRIDPTDPGDLDPEAPEFVPQKLSEASWIWVQYHLSVKAAEAVRLVLEDQYTQEEAARATRVNVRTVKRAFATLRQEAQQASDQANVP